MIVHRDGTVPLNLLIAVFVPLGNIRRRVAAHAFYAKMASGPLMGHIVVKPAVVCVLV